MNANEIKLAQSAGKTLLVCDVDRSFDVAAMAAAGVDVSRLLVSQPSNERQLHDVARDVIKAGVVDLVLFVGRVSPFTQTQIRIAATGNRAELVFA